MLWKHVIPAKLNVGNNVKLLTPCWAYTTNPTPKPSSSGLYSEITVSMLTLRPPRLHSILTLPTPNSYFLCRFYSKSHTFIQNLYLLVVSTVFCELTFILVKETRMDSDSSLFPFKFEYLDLSDLELQVPPLWMSLLLLVHQGYNTLSKMPKCWLTYA